MATRHFIGWSEAAPARVVRWCRGQWPEALPPGLIFCVPTSLALRRLRDALIDAYGSFQGVRFLTPSALPTLFAPPAETQAATPSEMFRVWARVFDWLRQADPSDAVLASLFPGQRAWLDRPAARYALARRLMALRDTLAEQCLDFAAVAAHPQTALLGDRERNRWAALDLLETKCRETLAALGLEDPADRQLAILRNPVPQPQEAAAEWRLVVACVPDLMPALTRLFDAAPACLQEPMRDLIPQVQNLMRLRRFRIMTNRYVSAAAAVVLAFVLWGFASMGASQRMADRTVQPQEPRVSLGQWWDTTVSGFYNSLDDTFSNFTLAAENSLAQLQHHEDGGTSAKGD